MLHVNLLHFPTMLWSRFAKLNQIWKIARWARTTLHNNPVTSDSLLIFPAAICWYWGTPSSCNTYATLTHFTQWRIPMWLCNKRSTTLSLSPTNGRLISTSRSKRIGPLWKVFMWSFERCDSSGKAAIFYWRNDLDTPIFSGNYVNCFFSYYNFIYYIFNLSKLRWTNKQYSQFKMYSER